ncbi:hypothetical protein O3P69_004498 [Scylla paramamosain]|uniref:Ionotropic glutamate receptor C-terminal domain-containing protein n=1 Tax=Scylla paramamosain TaxID=85552 RepID=A0AAW0UGD4_SCYPA
MRSPPNASCTTIAITDSTTTPPDVVKDVFGQSALDQWQVMATFEVTLEKRNTTITDRLSKLIPLARQLQTLLPAHWTFFMMNTVFLNMEGDAEQPRCGMYTYLPYSKGGSQMVKIAFWTPAHGFKLLSSVSFFQNKFQNFYGAKVNVTSEPYMPYWDEEEVLAADGSKTIVYRGSDYRMVDAIASTLNFTVRVLPTSSWTELIRAGHDRHPNVGVGAVFQDMVGMLLSQNLPRRLSYTSSSRVLVAAWLVFALILGVAYRGNLTASLTLPKYPPRPETLKEIVDSVDIITIPSYGKHFRKYYSDSESPLFQALGNLLNPGPSLMEGLKMALVKRSGHLDARKYIQYQILDKFTEKDGSTPLYVARGSVSPTPSGWPIPHDAPYKAHLDRLIVATLEAGLYDKWTADLMRETKLRSQRRQRQRYAAGHEGQAELMAVNEDGLPTLTINHTQGAFILLLLASMVVAAAAEHQYAREAGAGNLSWRRNCPSKNASRINAESTKRFVYHNRHNGQYYHSSRRREVHFSTQAGIDVKQATNELQDLLEKSALDKWQVMATFEVTLEKRNTTITDRLSKLIPLARQLQDLLPAHWTFSMMNTVFLNMEGDAEQPRCGMYTYLPYSKGGSQMVKIALWTPAHGFKHLSSVSFFQDKFQNFYGGKVNVTSGPYMPYWDEEEVLAADGSKTILYRGSDYLMVDAIASALNFTIRVLPTSSWAELIRAGHDGNPNVGVGAVFQDMVGMLLGQNLPRRVSYTSSSRVLVAAWLAFALILGLAYRGNLTASLTLPKYPPRPETLKEIINNVDMITIPSYGEHFRKFYSDSESPLFQALGSLMNPGPSLMEGLKMALVKRSSHLDGRKYIQYQILDKFTEKDGSTPFYVTREFVSPTPAGWPIPHDAPYKAHLDRLIVATLEAGLYDKWTGDLMRETKLRSQRRQRQRHAAGHDAQGELMAVNEDGLPTLTINHTQGAFILLLLGFVFNTLIFSSELLCKI